MRRRAGLFALALLGAAPTPQVALDRLLADAPAPKLSDYRLFADAAASRPAAGVVGYTLNTPLFSDYAAKQRYLYLPAGAPADYRGDGPLALPVGAVLVKTFAYPTDLRAPGVAVRKIETRLLIHRTGGWVPLTYVWNAAGTEAVLQRAGARTPVAFTDAQGARVALDYAVPNVNQCRQCHSQDGATTPIGPTAANLNRDGQLEAMAAAGRLAGLPTADMPRLARWDDIHATLDARARAYLDVNCGHCHSRGGLASNSGLYLKASETDPTAWGIGKRPVAAGRGSGGMQFAIAPGDPDHSILLHRMASDEPGVMMPQFGRSVAHTEALALIGAWIAAMPGA